MLHKQLIMTRNELLKLPEGKYLLTDTIGNYKYILWRFNDEKIENGSGLIAFLFDYNYMGAPFSSSVSIHYSDEEIEVDWSYNKLPIKTLRGLMSMGGLDQHYDFGSHLTELRMVGKYNKDTMSEDIKKFKVNLWANTSRYDKKWNRNYRLKREN